MITFDLHFFGWIEGREHSITHSCTVNALPHPVEEGMAFSVEGEDTADAVELITGKLLLEQNAGNVTMSIPWELDNEHYRGNRSCSQVETDKIRRVLKYNGWSIRSMTPVTPEEVRYKKPIIKKSVTRKPDHVKTVLIALVILLIGFIVYQFRTLPPSNPYVQEGAFAQLYHNVGGYNINGMPYYDGGMWKAHVRVPGCLGDVIVGANEGPRDRTPSEYHVLEVGGSPLEKITGQMASMSISAAVLPDIPGVRARLQCR